MRPLVSFDCPKRANLEPIIADWRPGSADLRADLRPGRLEETLKGEIEVWKGLN